jgi:hypothetical protein
VRIEKAKCGMEIKDMHVTNSQTNDRDVDKLNTFCNGAACIRATNSRRDRSDVDVAGAFNSIN